MSNKQFLAHCMDSSFLNRSALTPVILSIAAYIFSLVLSELVLPQCDTSPPHIRHGFTRKSVTQSIF